MSVYKKNGKWYFKGKLKNEYGAYVNYNRLAKNSRIGKEAKKEEADFVLKYTGKAINNAKSNLTFQEVADLYFDEMKGSLKTSTIITNKTVLNKMKFLVNKKTKLITSESLRVYFKKMDNDKFQLSYIDKIYNTINKILKYAVKNKYIFENPMNDIGRIKRLDELKKEVQFYTYEDYEWIKKASNLLDPYDVIINFLYLHGCRKGEAYALTWNDIDMKKQTIKINKTLNHKVEDKPYIITPPKTKNSVRTCKMCKELYDIMIEYKNSQIKLIGFNKDRFVFGFDKPISSTTLDRKKKELIEKTNKLIELENVKHNASISTLLNIRIHDLRHSHASLLINNGANMLAVAKRLGDTTETVMKVYAHMFTSAEDELINIMNSKYKK